jgi:hypothetical protein
VLWDGVRASPRPDRIIGFRSRAGEMAAERQNWELSPMTLRDAFALFLTVAAALWFAAVASPGARGKAMGIAFEGFPYPYPVDLLSLTLRGEDLRPAFRRQACWPCEPRRTERQGRSAQ